MPPPGGRPSMSSIARMCITYCSIAASCGHDCTISADNNIQSKIQTNHKSLQITNTPSFQSTHTVI